MPRRRACSPDGDWLVEVTVTAYCLLSVRPGAPRLKSFEFGSIGLDRPESIVRPMVTGTPVPSKVRKVACTDATPSRGSG